MDRLKRETSSALFERWRAAYRMEPFGDDWLQAATIASAAINPHIKKSIPVRDFIPNYRREEEMSDEQIAGTLNAICAAFGIGGA